MENSGFLGEKGCDLYTSRNMMFNYAGDGMYVSGKKKTKLLIITMADLR